MAVFKEVDNLPAGTTFKPGDNAEIDAAVADGTLAGVTIGADGSYIMEDGNPITSAGGTTTVADLSQATAEDLAAIKELAEAQFLAQTTGVKSSVLNAAYEKLGLDPNDVTVSSLAEKVLSEAGYTPGVTDTFFDGVGGYSGSDTGIKILIDRYAEKPTDQDLIDAGLDPEEYTVTRNNAAEAFYVESKLNEMGVGADSTNAILGSTARFLGGDQSSLGMRGALSVEDVRSEAEKLIPGRDEEKMLDIFEWDLIKKKKKDTGVDTTGYTSAVGNVNLTGGVSQTGGNTTGGGTPSVYQGPTFVSTPNIGTVSPVMSSGTYEATLPTYEAGLGKQKTQFDNRAIEQAKLYQPQTQAEKEALAATDQNYTAPAFENVLYRNRFGMSQYIQHINGVPSQPIPPGYYKVESFTDQSQTQAGSAAQGGNKGGMIQGFNTGATVNPALNYQPGGTIIGEGDRFRIQYPDGTMSQLYTSQADAQAANQMGLTNLGLPDYNTYLTNQGIDVNLGGYDEAAFQDAYQTYITDPATLQNIQAQQEKEEVVDTTPQFGNVNLDFPTGEMAVDREALAQYQANLNAQAYAAPGGAVAASPTAYIDPNTYGSVIESTAGQALATAPMVQEDQVAQIGSATQAIGPGYEGLKPMDYANMALEISTGLREYDPRFDTNGDGTVTSADALAIANGSFQVQQLESEKAYVQPEASQYTANQAYTDVSTATGEMSAVTSDGPSKTIDAAQQAGSSLTGLTSAARDSIDVTAPDARTLETIDGQSELITGTGVDQAKVLAAFGEGEIKAASVQDELTGLMKQFEGGDTPAWAAGSMRAAMATLAARGLGASSMAGQAVIQAAMEAALPIAQIDASNKQQMALFKGEQRAKFLQIEFDQAFQAKVMNAAKISEIANMNFTAEQQIALENSKAANTMELQNLSNEQALVMAEAAALSQMDMANLNNRQQAAVQNAQNFLQVDMANLANEQQTALFKQQSLINSILSDQAAANAAAQFNATSENQTNQFFANLAASVSQFNAAQMNAMKQFNADEVNSLLEFNASMQNQREMFNAQNYLVVAQANAQWRQNLATINTAAANESNMAYTQAVNGLTMTSLDEIWQRERDILSMAFQISENNANRANEIVIQKLAADSNTDAAKLQAEIESAAGAGDFVKEVFLKIIGI